MQDGFGDLAELEMDLLFGPETPPRAKANGGSIDDRNVMEISSTDDVASAKSIY